MGGKSKYLVKDKGVQVSSTPLHPLYINTSCFFIAVALITVGSLAYSHPSPQIINPVHFLL